MATITEAEVLKMLKAHSEGCRKMSESDVLKHYQKTSRWIIGIAVGVLVSIWTGSIVTAISFTRVKTRVDMLIQMEQSKIKAEDTNYYYKYKKSGY
jgi:hypothetical protein